MDGWAEGASTTEMNLGEKRKGENRTFISDARALSAKRGKGEPPPSEPPNPRTPEPLILVRHMLQG